MVKIVIRQEYRITSSSKQTHGQAMRCLTAMLDGCLTVLRKKMIKSMIEESKDADKIAKLNESVQNLHYERYPEQFKLYSYDSVLQYVKEQLSKDNYHAYIIGDQNDEYGYVLFFEQNYMENPFRKAYLGN